MQTIFSEKKSMQFIVIVLIFSKLTLALDSIDAVMCQKNLISSGVEKLKSMLPGFSCKCEKPIPQNKCSPYVQKRVEQDHCAGSTWIFKSKSSAEACSLTKSSQSNLSGQALEDYYRKTLDFDDPSIFKVAEADCYRGKVSTADKKQIPAQYYYFLNKLRAGSLAAIRQMAAADLALGNKPFSDPALEKSCPVEGLPQTQKWCTSMHNCSAPPINPQTGHTEAFDQMVGELGSVQLVHRQLKDKLKYLPSEFPEHKAIQRVLDNLEANYPALKDKAFLSKAYTGEHIAEAYNAYLGRVKERSRNLLDQFRKATKCLSARDGGALFDTADCKQFDKTIASAPDFDKEAVSVSGSKRTQRNQASIEDYAFNTECRIRERDRVSEDNSSFLQSGAMGALTVATMGASAGPSLARAGIVGVDEATVLLVKQVTQNVERSAMLGISATNVNNQLGECRKLADKIDAPPFSMSNAGAPPSCVNMAMPELAKARNCYGEVIGSIGKQVLMAAANRMLPGSSSETSVVKSGVVSSAERSVVGAVSNSVERNLENSLQRLGGTFLQVEKNGAAQDPGNRLLNLFRAARNSDIRDGEAINKRILQIAGKVDKPESVAAAAADPFFKYRKANTKFDFARNVSEMARTNYVEPAKALFQSYRAATTPEQKKDLLSQMSHFFCLITQFEGMGTTLTRPGELDALRSALSSNGLLKCQ